MHRQHSTLHNPTVHHERMRGQLDQTDNSELPLAGLFVSRTTGVGTVTGSLGVDS